MQKWKVLLVDDEKEFVSALSERLMLRGLDVRIAFSGEEALGSVKSDPPQVVVLDVMMPGLGGAEVFRRIRELHPNIPVIFLTGQGCSVDRRQTVPYGVFECLVKPLDIDDLIRTIGSAVCLSESPALLSE